MDKYTVFSFQNVEIWHAIVNACQIKKNTFVVCP